MVVMVAFVSLQRRFLVVVDFRLCFAAPPFPIIWFYCGYACWPSPVSMYWFCVVFPRPSSVYSVTSVVRFPFLSTEVFSVRVTLLPFSMNVWVDMELEPGMPPELEEKVYIWLKPPMPPPPMEFICWNMLLPPPNPPPKPPPPKKSSSSPNIPKGSRARCCYY